MDKEIVKYNMRQKGYDVNEIEARYETITKAELDALPSHVQKQIREVLYIEHTGFCMKGGLYPSPSPEIVEYAESEGSSVTKFNMQVMINPVLRDCSFMFFGCWTLSTQITIPEFAVDCSHMFEDCRHLDTPILIPPNVKRVANMFEGCFGFRSLISAPSYLKDILKVPSQATVVWYNTEGYHGIDWQGSKKICMTLAEKGYYNIPGTLEDIGAPAMQVEEAVLEAIAKLPDITNR